MDRGRKSKHIHVDQPHTASGATAQLSTVASCTSPSDLGRAVSEPWLVRRRLDMPHPGSSITTESRKWRRFVIASGAEKENSAPLLCNGHRRTIFGPLYLGGPTCTCPHCGARFWLEEQVRGCRTTNPVYNRCCRGGSIVLPSYRPPPQPLLHLLTREDPSHFFDNIRRYNSMFAMTSMGVKVINAINDGHGPYVFKISGQLCHRVGSLIPAHGKRPEYCQLYIFDTGNEIQNRMTVAEAQRADFHPNEALVAAFIAMFDTHNPIVKTFRTARDRLAATTLSDRLEDHYAVKLFSAPKQHGNIYSDPVASEVVGLVVNDLGNTDKGLDLVVQQHSSQLQRIQETHCKFMVMQYPLLFPYGEDGFHDHLYYMTCPCSNKMKRQKNTMAEYYSYGLHDRAGDFNTPLRCSRLTQAYQVDAYCCVEDERLRHYRKESFQKKYRSSPYNALVQAVRNGITEASSVGQITILPGSFTGSPRYYYQNYQDCVAICRRFGCPDLFITFTCNALWTEIEDALSFIPEQHASDRPDIVDRVFQTKLKLLMDDIEKYDFLDLSLELSTQLSFKSEIFHMSILYCGSKKLNLLMAIK